MLVSPGMDEIRHLNVLVADLSLLRRALTPIHLVLATLRHHDIERGAAALSTGGSLPPSTGFSATPGGAPHLGAGAFAASPGMPPRAPSLLLDPSSGFLSPQVRVYLAVRPID